MRMKSRNCCFIAIFSVLQFQELIFGEFAGSFGENPRNPFADLIGSYKSRLAGIEDRFIGEINDGRASYNGDKTDAQAKLELHGGIPMGVINEHCDDAKTFLEVDWDRSSDIEYACQAKPFSRKQGPSPTHCDEVQQRPLHVCLPDPIQYTEQPPLSGAHRPLWPVYGEYEYCPPQRWLHSLEHGAVVLLYHPCADKGDVNILRDMVKSCLRKHIITPYRHLTEEQPMMLLTWKCKLPMTFADIPEALTFMRTHALDAPEGYLPDQGQYSYGLTEEALEVSDRQDSVICPEFPPMEDNTGPLKNFQN